MDCPTQLEKHLKSSSGDGVTHAIDRTVDMSPAAINAVSGPEGNNILDTAKLLTAVERQADYGHPIEDFTCAGNIISNIIKRRTGHDISITPDLIPLFMIAIKLSRESNKHKLDNLIDIAGYARTAQMVQERMVKEDE